MELNDNFKYEKLIDDLFYFGNKAILKFVLDLGRKDKDGMKSPYHSEFSYYTNKYPNVRNITTLKRNFNFYLLIEQNLSKDERTSIQIRVQDILYLRQILNTCYAWFTDRKFAGLFQRTKDHYQITKNIPKQYLDRLGFDTYLAFEPCIIFKDEREDIGVRIYLNSETNYIEIDVNKLMGFKYLIDSINMYESAQLMLNYLPSLEYGTNAVNFDSDYIPEDQEGMIESKNNNRVIGSEKKKPKSFFDRMDSI